MRSVALLLPLALLLTPLASAQAPAPSDVVGQVCHLAHAAPVDVPVCPREEPAGPQPQDPAHEHPAAPQAPGKPEDAQALAADVAGQAQAAAQEPQTAPNRLAAIVAAIVQFVKDLVHLPVAGAEKVGQAFKVAGAKVALAGKMAQGGLDAAVAKVKTLLHGLPHPAPARASAPHAAQQPVGAARRLLPKLPVDLTPSSP